MIPYHLLQYVKGNTMTDKEILEKLEDYEWFETLVDIKDKILLPFRQFCKGVTNLIDWFPVIWKDRHWDEHFMYKVFRKKFILKRDYFEKYGIAKDNPSYVKQLDLCVKLLNRLIEQDYINNAYKYHEKKWGEIELETKQSEKYPDMYEVDVFRTRALKEEDQIRERIESKFCCERESMLEQQDLDLLCKTIKTHARSWWD